MVDWFSTWNQIYEPKLEVESKNAFGKCSKDIFEVVGPCVDQICFFYLYKNGSDDWIPETVQISGSDINTVEYKYNSSIPRETWYGFDDCDYFPPPSPPPPPPPPAPSAAGRRLPATWRWLAYAILCFSAALWCPPWCGGLDIFLFLIHRISSGFDWSIKNCSI